MAVRKLGWIPVALLFSLVFSGIASADWRSDGLDSEDRDVIGFQEVVVGITGTVILEQGDTEGVTVEAEPEMMDEIITSVRGRRLLIEFKSKGWNWGWNSSRSGKIVVTVRFKNLSAVSLGGSANIKCKSVKGDDLELTVSGSGDMWFGDVDAQWIETGISGSGSITVENTKTDRMRCRISGSGDMEFAGTASTLQTGITGSGTIDASGLQVKEANVRISGSGSTRVNVSDELTGSISGSGNVWYRGRPYVDVSTPGSGDVRPMR